MAKCETCGAPVNLAPDGDPKYEAPPAPKSTLTVGELFSRMRMVEQLSHVQRVSTAMGPVSGDKRMFALIAVLTPEFQTESRASVVMVIEEEELAAGGDKAKEVLDRWYGMAYDAGNPEEGEVPQ